MVSLRDFHIVKNPGEVSVCERDGRLCSLPYTEVDISNIDQRFNKQSYPDINLSREVFSSGASQMINDERRFVMSPQYEPPMKRLTRIFLEDGIVETLIEARNLSHSGNSKNIIGSIANFLLYFYDIGKKINFLMRPHLKSNENVSIGNFSQTLNWSNSLIRHIKLHPNCFKLAVAAVDDTIRVYSDDQTNMPILKSFLQKNISSMCWRPYTAGELAVGCQNGILIWILDPNSHITRHISHAHQLKYENHFPVSSVDWNRNGNLLASCSLNDSDILIWDVDQNRNSPLKRIGQTCSFLLWSPNSSRLFSATIGNVFRVWTTKTWTPERWTVPNGTIRSAAWSPCSEYLLFITSEEPFLYSLRFIEDELFTTSSIFKQALPIADLSRVKIDHVDVGGRPQSISWDPSGKHVAVIFKDSPIIALFSTTINRHLLNISPSCFLIGIESEYPVHICFHPKYKDKNEIILNIAWSSGRIQYFPFI